MRENKPNPNPNPTPSRIIIDFSCCHYVTGKSGGRKIYHGATRSYRGVVFSDFSSAHTACIQKTTRIEGLWYVHSLSREKVQARLSLCLTREQKRILSHQRESKFPFLDTSLYVFTLIGDVSLQTEVVGAGPATSHRTVPVLSRGDGLRITSRWLLQLGFFCTWRIAEGNESHLRQTLASTCSAKK